MKFCAAQPSMCAHRLAFLSVTRFVCWCALVRDVGILAMLCRTVAELDHISSPTAMAEQPWL